MEIDKGRWMPVMVEKRTMKGNDGSLRKLKVDKGRWIEMKVNIGQWKWIKKKRWGRWWGVNIAE